jgi:biopolymer transport protein ExbD
MRFLVRKRRSAPTVIIVALVDVLIVLLIFLMVTTTFKQRPALQLQLPESSKPLQQGATTNEPPFIVSINSSNVIIVGMDKMPIPFDSLKARLQQEAAKNPQFKLAIAADKNAHWDRIVSVMEIAHDLNIKSVSASLVPAKEPGKP